jgi:hypothetical protein
MKKTVAKLRSNSLAGNTFIRRFGFRSIAAQVILAAMTLMTVLSVQAQQTVRISPDVRVQYIGAEHTRVYSNILVRIVNSGDSNQLDISAVGPLNTTITFNTNSFIPGTNTTTTQLIMFIAATNVALGSYPVTINVSGGATASTNILLIAGHLWEPDTTNDLNWTTAGNWTPNSVPGPNDNVIFKDSDVSMSNFLSSTITVGSLNYLRDTNGTVNETAIGSGATLSVTGSNGVVVSVDTIIPNSKQANVQFHGPGGTFAVNNPETDFVMNSVNTGGNGTTVNMTNLDTLILDVNRFGAGDATFAGYEGAIPRLGAQNVNISLAKTNIIRLYYNEPFTSDSIRFTNAMQLFQNGNDFNNGAANTFSFGISNLVLAESFGAAISRVGAAGNLVRFHPQFISTNFPVPYVKFRGTNGGRMKFFGLAIDDTTNSSGSNTRITANFNGGTLDLLAEEMVIARTPSFGTNQGNARAEGHLLFNRGTVDVNLLRLGYHPFMADNRSQGDITVVSNGILVVNNELQLGTFSGNAAPLGAAHQGWGRLIINNGGTVRANSITVAATTNLDSRITMSGGNLVVSNTVASPDSRLRLFSMDNRSVITLFVDAALTTPYIYVSNLTTLGVINTIRIPSLANVTTYPAQIPLISYESATANPNIVIDLPIGGVFASMVNNTGNGTIDVVLDTNPPPTLVWSGTASANWDTAALNWNNGTTNFANGAFVRFDDSATGNTNITVVGTVIPAQSSSSPGTVVSNILNDYSFSVGTISGSGTLVKQGPGMLTIDAISEVPMVVEDGIVAGSGAIGITVIQSDAALVYTGNINGGLDSAGLSINSGTLTGPLVVRSGGIVTNMGTMSGSVNFQTNAILVNTETGFLNVSGAVTVDNNSLFENSGTTELDSPLTISGTFTGTGKIERDASTANLGTAPVNIGGTFSPGTPASPIGTNTVSTRLNLNSGSRTIIEVDTVNNVNDLIVATTLNFGTPPSPALIVMTNINGSFAVGQAFQIFTNSFGDPFIPIGGDPGWNTNNILFDIRPVSPGLGMAWETSDLRTNGIIRITAVNTTPPVLDSGLLTVFTTNLVTTNISTNVVFKLDWPDENTGWRLEQQANSLSVGLNTNWTTVPFSQLSNEFSFPFVITNPAVFYRLVHP